VLPESVIHISESVHRGLMRRSQLQRGDLLIAIVGATIGESGIYEYDEPANINQAIAAVRFRDPDVLLDYARWYLHSSLGKGILDYLKRPVARANINLEEISEIPLIIPSHNRQRALVSEMEAARVSRKAKLDEADALLAAFDAYLLAQLGLTTSQPDGRLLYAVRLADVRRERFDAHYYHPQFRNLERLLQGVTHKRLGDIITPSNEQRNPPDSDQTTFHYIEISGVDRHTGEVSVSTVASKDAPSRARMAVRQEDLIVSLTRPHHGSIALIDNRLDGCIASTGFSILRQLKDSSIKRHYLLAVLRSQLCLPQMLQRSSGGNYPAITEPELMQILIPTPDIDTQDRIVAEHSRRHLEARHLRDEARREWEEAKARFEAQLLGEETV